jgi:gliding-associated putative ABC transporter substrate-binding component GldG
MMKFHFSDIINSNRRLWSLILTVIIILLTAFVLSSFFFLRLDLTSEKRYTLSDFTRKTLKNLNDIVYVKVYLDGDLNIPFGKMKQGIRETLDEFRVYAGDNLQYEFINPFRGLDASAREKVITDLYGRGLQPSNIISGDEEGGTEQKIIFPGAFVTYRGTEVPVNFLKNNALAGPEENINNSVQSLEFDLIRVINTLASDSVEKVAFLEGQGELGESGVYDITRELAWFFQVDRGSINGTPGILDDYKAVIIAKPSLPFTEQDKFVLDQYIMNGGRVLWFLDMVKLSMDSLSQHGYTIAMADQLNIEDMLFRYGVRINPVLLQDYQCNVIPLNMALPGNSPDFRFMPWYYYPLLNPLQSHPVTKNLSQIKSEFASDIDTTGPGRKLTKTILLSTSDLTRKVIVPTYVSLAEAAQTESVSQFNEKSKAVAILLEGSFESSFRNRILGEIIKGSYTFRDTSKLTSMLVVGDGDIIRNEDNYPLGFDRYTQRTFANKDFIVNAIHYMTGHNNLIRLRSRELSLRLLDKEKISRHRLFWVLLNTLGPSSLVIIAGIFFNLYRKKRYGRS